MQNLRRPDRPGFEDPNRLESGGGGLVTALGPAIDGTVVVCNILKERGETLDVVSRLTAMLVRSTLVRFSSAGVRYRSRSGRCCSTASM